MNIVIADLESTKIIQDKMKDSCPCSFREQHKVAWRLFKAIKSIPTYERFKELIYSDAKQDNDDEVSFVDYCQTYNKMLKSEITSKEFVEHFVPNVFQH